MKTLYLAAVGHISVPGLRHALFYQEDEPTDEEIFARFGDFDPDSLELDSLIDFDWVVRNNPANEQALAEYLASTLGAENERLRKALTTIANSEEWHGNTLVCDFQTLQGVARAALKTST